VDDPKERSAQGWSGVQAMDRRGGMAVGCRWRSSWIMSNTSCLVRMPMSHKTNRYVILLVTTGEVVLRLNKIEVEGNSVFVCPQFIVYQARQPAVLCALEGRTVLILHRQEK